MNACETDTNGTARLRIRLMEHRDLEELRVFHNQDDVLLKLTDPAHISQPQQEAWFISASTSRNARRYVARSRSDDSLVGIFRVDGMDSVNGNAFVGCDIVPACQGQGYATEFFIYVLDYLFNSCRLHRVELVTLHNNVRAINLYKKLGFVDEGARREALFRDGVYQDLVSMGLLADEWRVKRTGLLQK